MTYVIIIATVIVGILIYLLYYVYTLKKPAKGSCDFLKSSNPNVKWNKDCSYIEESGGLDTSLKIPTHPLLLVGFTNAPGMGTPWGVNVWYRYNYDDVNTGKFSEPSQWTLSPISAGSTNLPCGSNCNGIKYTGKDSCQSNLATLGLPTALDYGVGSGVYANVHRYVTTLSNTTPPTNKTPGKIVGMLIPSTSGTGAMFVDTSTSPCKDVPCTNVPGC